MKKVFMALIFVFLLSACSSSSSSEQTVKEWYEAALNQDIETFEQISSQYEKIRGRYVEASSDLAEIVHDLGGTENLEFKELNKGDIRKEVVGGLDSNYENGWTMVMVEPKKDSDENSEDKPPFFGS